MFKDIPGYEGVYQVNECGYVINLKKNPPKIVNPAIAPNGHLRLTLQKDTMSPRINMSVHRLVAMAFLPNPNNLPVVMHLDNDPLNNHVSNLKWGTYSENIQQAFDEGRLHSPHLGHHEPRFYYQVYNDDNSDVITCFGYEETAALIRYRPATISNMITYQTKIALGPYAGYRIRKVQKLYHLVDNSK